MILKQWNKTDRWIFSGAIFLVLLMLYFLYDDSLILPSTHSNAPVVAEITVADNDVRIKDAKQFVWRSVRNISELREGDSIFTGPGSTVTLTFKNGRKLVLQENSMFVMTKQNNELKLDLQFGRFTASADPGLKIAVKGQDLTPQPIAQTESGVLNPVEIKVGADGKIKIKKANSDLFENPFAILGLAKTASPAAIQAAYKKLSAKYLAQKNAGNPLAAQMLEKIQSAFDTLSDPQKRKLASLPTPEEAKKLAAGKTGTESISWVTPPPKKFRHYKHTNLLKLAWKSSIPSQKYTVQFATDPDFKTIVYTEATRLLKLETVGYPQEGKYYVRVAGLQSDDQSDLLSPTAEVDFSLGQTPRILAPTLNQVFQFDSDPDGNLLQPAVVNTKWSMENTTPTTNYEILYATDPLFRTIVWTTQLKGLTTTTPPLAPGQYHVKVREVFSEAETVWSEAVSFSVNYKEPQKLPPPVLVTEDIRYLAPDSNPIEVAWKPVNGAAKYLFEISSDDSFTDKKSYDAVSSQLNLSDFNPGKSYFRVFALTKSGRSSEASKTGELTVKIKNPVLGNIEPRTVMGETNEQQAPPQEFDIAWTDLKYPPAYSVELSPDPSFRKKTTTRALTPDGKITVPSPGKYYVRVRGLSEKEKPVTGYSNVGEIDYQFKVPMQSPLILEPLDQISLIFQKADTPYIWLEWKPVRQAVRYNIQFALDPNFERQVFSITTTGRRYLVKKKVPQGVLFWRMQAVGEGELISNWTNPRTMTVFSGKAMENRLPANQERRENGQ